MIVQEWNIKNLKSNYQRRINIINTSMRMKKLILLILSSQKYNICTAISGSMADTIDGKPMMDIAKNSINNFVSDLPDEVNMGLRDYGHEGKATGKTKEESCEIS